MYICVHECIRSGPKHPFHGALTAPYVQIRVTRGALEDIGVLTRLLASEPCKYSRTFITLSVSLRNDIVYHVLDAVRLAGFEIGANSFLLA